MTHAASSGDDQEFWLFVQNAPLPSGEELQQAMFRLDPCFQLNLSGAPEESPDHVLEGSYLDEDPNWTCSGSWRRKTRAKPSNATLAP